MRRFTLPLALVLCAGLAPIFGADSGTQQQLEKIHAAWFSAYDSGDGAAMDKLETDNIALGLPDGSVWYKKESRTKDMKARKADVIRSLNAVVVREFGDTAILTGTVVSKYGAETEYAGTTVVFVRSDGAWKICSAQWTDRMADKKT